MFSALTILAPTKDTRGWLFIDVGFERCRTRFTTAAC
jgi:hypothetical protein